MQGSLGQWSLEFKEYYILQNVRSFSFRAAGGILEILGQRQSATAPGAPSQMAMTEAMTTTADRKQLQLEKYGTHLSGFVAAAHTPGYGREASFALPLNLQELKLQLSVEFGLQTASVQMRTWCAVSAGAPVAMWAELSSQDDLVAAVEELNDMGMHQLSIEVTGRSSVRALEALSGGIGLLATAAWLWWTSLLYTDAPESEWAGPSLKLALAVLVANGLVAAISSGDTELSAWLARRWPLVLLAPLTAEALLLVSSGAGGCVAPLPLNTRRALMLWGSATQLVGRGFALYVMQAAMADDEAAAAFSAVGVVSSLPMLCASLLAVSGSLSLSLLLTELMVGGCRASMPAAARPTRLPPTATVAPKAVIPAPTRLVPAPAALPALPALPELPMPPMPPMPPAPPALPGSPSRSGSPPAKSKPKGGKPKPSKPTEMH